MIADINLQNHTASIDDGDQYLLRLSSFSISTSFLIFAAAKHAEEEMKETVRNFEFALYDR